MYVQLEMTRAALPAITHPKILPVRSDWSLALSRQQRQCTSHILYGAAVQLMPR